MQTNEYLAVLLVDEAIERCFDLMDNDAACGQ